MVKAEIRTSSGAVIIVDGTSNEVNEIMRFWQLQEDRFKYQRAHFRHYNEEYINKKRESAFFSESNTLRSPKAIILELIGKKYFNNYRELSEIRKQIEEQYNTAIPNSSLHPTLMLLIAQGDLRRSKQENGRWGYKIQGMNDKGGEGGERDNSKKDKK